MRCASMAVIHYSGALYTAFAGDMGPANAGSMTIRQMLSHTAGVFDHLNSNDF